MGANLDDIDNAMLSALQGLLKSAPSPGPFAFVGRWAGQLPREDQISSESFGASPAALLAAAGESGGADANFLDGDREDKGIVNWTVIIALQDPRGAKQVTKGGAIPITQPGMLTLIDTVISGLNGLIVPEGLIRNERVRYVGWQWLGIIPGRIAVVGVRFTSTRFVPMLDVEDNLPALNRITGNLHLKDQSDPTPANADPIDVFKSP